MSLREHLEEAQIYEQKTGADIARELGITRQAVSSTLKRAMKKAYMEARKIENWSPFEAAVAMSIMFGQQNENVNKFFKLFPPDIRKEIEADAKEKFGKKV